MRELKNPEHVVSMTLEELEDNINNIETTMILEKKIFKQNIR